MADRNRSNQSARNESGNRRTLARVELRRARRAVKHARKLTLRYS